MSVETFHEGRVALHGGDCLDVVPQHKLRASPCNRHLEIGKAAEHLVCADLILSGYRAFLSDQGLPYDVVFDVGGRLLRVQVKSSSRPRPVPGRPASAPSYMFNVRRAGKGGKRRIGNSEFELLALVALDIRVVAYLPISEKVLQTVHLRVPENASGHGNRGRGNVDEFPVGQALAELGL